MMSARQSAGSCLEGTAAISIKVGPQPKFLDRLRQQVDPATDQRSQTSLQGYQGQQPNARLRFKLNSKIDVTT